MCRQQRVPSGRSTPGGPLLAVRAGMTTPQPNPLARIAAGDQSAFAAFYDEHAARVFGLLLKLVRNRSDAEELLQETFHQAWQQAGRYDAALAAPIVWLLMIARSRALDFLRKSARRAAAAPQQPEITTLSAAEVAVAADDAGRTRSALASLPDDQRGVIQLAYYQGLTHEEIAERESLPLGTVKTRIRLGIRRLREALDGDRKSVAS